MGRGRVRRAGPPRMPLPPVAGRSPPRYPRTGRKNGRTRERSRMTRAPAARTLTTPRDDDLGLRRIANRAGLSIGVLPNGCIFAIEHRHEGRGPTVINQVLGSPLVGGI